ncbi:hypothetical protein KEM52_005052 [Ascosphaera acerosa]|nr:hypothetical protein KEM52_005052 [Ascosphaera acerosa]
MASEDLRAFHERHFPAYQPKTSHAQHVISNDGTTGQEMRCEGHDQVDYDDDDDDDDGLGYYADGTKRTLTDEQIYMFRHTEIQQALRRREARRRDGAPTAAGRGGVAETSSAAIESSQSAPSTARRARSRRAQKSKKRRLQPGLPAVNTDGSTDVHAPGPAQLAGRRIVSYAD